MTSIFSIARRNVRQLPDPTEPIAIPEIELDMRTTQERHAESIQAIIEKLDGKRMAERLNRDELRRLSDDCEYRAVELDHTIHAYKTALSILANNEIDA